MGVIADLLVRVGSDITGAKKGLAEVGAGVEEAGTGFSKLGAIAGPAGLAVVGALTGLAAFGASAVQHATDAGEAAYELAEKFGLSGQQASSFLSVGKQLGLSAEEIGKGFQFLSKNVSAMQLTLDSGGKISAATGQVYKELGINVLTSGGKVKDANELMLEAADAFKAMKDGPEKAALAMKLFGKSGTDMLPMLNQGRAGIENLMASGKAMGDVMSNEQVEAAHKLAMEQKKLETAMSGVTTQIGLFLMPVMTRIMDFVLSTGIPAIQRLGSYFTDHIWPAVVQVASAFQQLLAPALKYIQGHFDSLKPVLIGIGIVLAIMVGAAVLAIGILVVAIVGIVAGVVWVATQIKAHWNDVVGFITGLPGRISSAVSGMWNGIWEEFRSILNKVIAAWNGLKFTTPSGDLFGQHVPSVTLAVPQIPYLHSGGIVPGARGQNVFAMLQAGERVSSADDVAENTSLLRQIAEALARPQLAPVVVNVTSPADPHDIAAELGWEITKLRRRR